MLDPRASRSLLPAPADKKVGGQRGRTGAQTGEWAGGQDSGRAGAKPACQSTGETQPSGSDGIWHEYNGGPVRRRAGRGGVNGTCSRQAGKPAKEGGMLIGGQMGGRVGGQEAADRGGRASGRTGGWTGGLTGRRANSGQDCSGDRDLTAKPENHSQNDHTNGGRERRGMLANSSPVQLPCGNTAAG